MFEYIIKIFSLSSFSSTEKREREKKKNRIAKRWCARALRGGFLDASLLLRAFAMFFRARCLWREGIYFPRMCLFSFSNFLRQNTLLPRKKILWDKQNTRTKTTKIGVVNRAQHASQRTLIFARNRLQSRIIICTPQGILDVAEYVACRVVFVLFLFLGPEIF